MKTGAKLHYAAFFGISVWDGGISELADLARKSLTLQCSIATELFISLPVLLLVLDHSGVGYFTPVLYFTYSKLQFTHAVYIKFEFHKATTLGGGSLWSITSVQLWVEFNSFFFSSISK